MAAVDNGLSELDKRFEEELKVKLFPDEEVQSLSGHDSDDCDASNYDDDDFVEEDQSKREKLKARSSKDGLRKANSSRRMKKDGEPEKHCPKKECSKRSVAEEQEDLSGRDSDHSGMRPSRKKCLPKRTHSTSSHGSGRSMPHRTLSGSSEVRALRERSRGISRSNSGASEGMAPRSSRHRPGSRSVSPARSVSSNGRKLSDCDLGEEEFEEALQRESMRREKKGGRADGPPSRSGSRRKINEDGAPSRQGSRRDLKSNADPPSRASSRPRGAISLDDESEETASRGERSRKNTRSPAPGARSRSAQRLHVPRSGSRRNVVSGEEEEPGRRVPSRAGSRRNLLAGGDTGDGIAPMRRSRRNLHAGGDAGDDIAPMRRSRRNLLAGGDDGDDNAPVHSRGSRRDVLRGDGNARGGRPAIPRENSMKRDRRAGMARARSARLSQRDIVREQYAAVVSNYKAEEEEEEAKEEEEEKEKDNEDEAGEKTLQNLPSDKSDDEGGKEKSSSKKSLFGLAASVAKTAAKTTVNTAQTAANVGIKTKQTAASATKWVGKTAVSKTVKAVTGTANAAAATAKLATGTMSGTNTKNKHILLTTQSEYGMDDLASLEFCINDSNPVA